MTELTCSFCGAAQAEVAKLFEAIEPQVHICDGCVGRCGAVMTGDGSGGHGLRLATPAEANSQCSFCGERPVGASALVVASGASICGLCVDLCRDVLVSGDGADEAGPTDRQCRLCGQGGEETQWFPFPAPVWVCAGCRPRAEQMGVVLTTIDADVSGVVAVGPLLCCLCRRSEDEVHSLVPGVVDNLCKTCAAALGPP